MPKRVNKRTIQVQTQTAKQLKELAIVPNETYDNIIIRLMKENKNKM